MPKIVALLCLPRFGMQDTPSPERIRVLIEKLRSESVAEREDASAQLRKMGRAAIPALEAALEDPDAELRGRAVSILTGFERRRRLLAFGPDGQRLSLDLRDSPFPDAVRKTFEPFGITAFRWDPGLAERRVTLRLKDATLWEAYETFCSDARVRPKQLAKASSWKFQDEKKGVSTVAWSDFANVRLVAGGGTFVKDGAGPWRSVISLLALLPPRVHASSSEVEIGEVLDDQGRQVEAEMKPLPPGSRKPGAVTSAKLWEALILPEKFKGMKSLRLKGTLTLRYPAELEAAVVELDELKLPAGVGLGGARLKIDEAGFNDKGDWVLRLQARGGPAETPILAWVEDDRGRWLFDVGSFEAPANGSMGATFKPFYRRKGRPVRLVFNRIVKEVESRIKFDLKGIPVPRVPKNVQNR